MARRTEEPARRAGADTAHALSQRPRVLLVEPERATRHLYARELGQLWQVLEAAGLAEARRHLGAERIAAVVLEPYSGAGDGAAGPDDAWEFLHECAGRGAPVLICSVVDERRTAYALGAALYLLKPVSSQQLVVALQGLMGAAATREHTS